VLTFEEAGPEETRMTMTFNATPQTFMAKVMMKVFSAMTKHLTKCIAEDLEDVKRAAEEDGPVDA
jgi:hypothetical protein